MRVSLSAFDDGDISPLRTTDVNDNHHRQSGKVSQGHRQEQQDSYSAAVAGCPPTASNNEFTSGETPPSLNNGKATSTGLVRRSSTLKTGEINLKKKLIIRRNSSRLGKDKDRPVVFEEIRA